MVKVVIADYSAKLGLYRVELYAGTDYLAMATGAKIETSKVGKRTMVALNDEDGIGQAFFHADIVEDLREVKR